MDQKKSKNRRIDGLYANKLKREEDFFSDVDKKNRSFFGFWFFAGVILAFIFFFLIYWAVSIKRANTNEGSGDVTETKENLLSFPERLNSLKNDGRAVLRFSGEEFIKASGADSDEFPLKNSTFEIDKDNIYLKGKIRDSFVPWSVRIKIIYLVEDQKFLFLVAPNSIENLVIYGQNKDKIEAVFDKNFNQTLKDRGVIAEGIKTSDDSVELDVIKETQ